MGKVLDFNARKKRCTKVVGEARAGFVTLAREFADGQTVELMRLTPEEAEAWSDLFLQLARAAREAK